MHKISKNFHHQKLRLYDSQKEANENYDDVFVNENIIVQ